MKLGNFNTSTGLVLLTDLTLLYNTHGPESQDKVKTRQHQCVSFINMTIGTDISIKTFI